jgi:hypothetical protein
MSKKKTKEVSGLKLLESGNYEKGFDFLMNQKLEQEEISKIIQLLPFLINNKTNGKSFKEPFLLLNGKNLTEKDYENIVKFILSNPKLLSEPETILSILKFKIDSHQKFISDILPFVVKCFDLNEEKMKRGQSTEVKKVLIELLDGYLSIFKNTHEFVKFNVFNSFFHLEIKFSEQFIGLLSIYIEQEDWRGEMEKMVVNLNSKKYSKVINYIFYLKKIFEFNNQFSWCMLKNQKKLFSLFLI